MILTVRVTKAAKCTIFHLNMPVRAHFTSIIG